MFVVFSDLTEDRAKVYDNWDKFAETQHNDLDSDITHAWSDEGLAGSVIRLEPETMLQWLKEAQIEASEQDGHNNTLSYSGN